MLQPYLDTIKTYCNNNKLLISPDKTIAIVFNRCFSRTYAPPKLFVDNHFIDVKNKVHLLGLLYDRHFNFNKHTIHIVGKCNHYINILRYLTSSKLGCNFYTLKMLFKSIILATLQYAYEAFHYLCKTASKRLDTFHTRSQCLCLGGLPPTPNNIILAECGEILLEMQHLHRLLIYCCKVMHTPNHISHHITTPFLMLEPRLIINIKAPNTTHAKIYPFITQHPQNPATKHQFTKPPWLMYQPIYNTYIADNTPSLQGKGQFAKAQNRPLCLS